MHERTLEHLIYHKGDFVEKYNYFRRTRFFYPDSVNDFCINKNVSTPLSNLIFFSNPNSRLFLFRDVSLKKNSDEVYNLYPPEGKSYVKLYSLEDETEKYLLFWPTCNSEVPHSVSCDQFEVAANFRGNELSEVLVIGFQNRRDCYVYHIDFNNNFKKRETLFPELNSIKVGFCH
jgi:hypothetical protein